MKVRMLSHVRVWDCECCGSIYDTSLTVEVGTQWTGGYYDDGHFGESHIDEARVEVDIAEALGLCKEYASRLERHAQLDAELETALKDASTEDEINAAYATHAAGCENFAQWLALQGHELVEEETWEENRSTGDEYEEEWDD